MYVLFFIIFLTVLGLYSLVGASGSYCSLGAWASRCSGCSCCRAQALGTRASEVVVHGLSCSEACGIFLDQGSSPRPLHWQANSLSSSSALSHQGSPVYSFSYSFPVWFVRGYWMQLPAPLHRTLSCIHPTRDRLHLLTPGSLFIPLPLALCSLIRK